MVPVKEGGRWLVRFLKTPVGFGLDVEDVMICAFIVGVFVWDKVF